MSKRLPIVLSVLALVISVLGATSAGNAAANLARGVVPPLALFANNAGKLQGHTSSTVPAAGQIPVLDASGALPASVLRNAPSFDASKVGLTGGPATFLAVGDYTKMTAICPAGSIVIGGGFDAHMIIAGDIRVTASLPDEGNQSWNVTVYNNPIYDRSTGQVATHTGKGKAYALCVKA